MSIRILATADLHLGKRSSGVPRTSEAGATRTTWKRITERAVELSVDALLLSGDIIDRDNRFFETLGPVQEGFETLRRAGIPVVMVAGNHDFDVLPDIIRNREYENVYLLGAGDNWSSVRLNGNNGAFQVLGWSFPSQYYRQDPLHKLPDVDLDLDPNLPTIGIIHGEVDQPESSYAPLAMTNLIPAPVHVWIAGHIHKPGILREQQPLVLYPGSPHALSSKEPGRHGPWLLTLDDNRVTDRKHLPLSPVRYEEFSVDATGISDESEFRSQIPRRLAEEAEGRAEELQETSRLICDIVLSGEHPTPTALHDWSRLADEFEQELIPETIVTIRRIENRARPKVENLEALAAQPTPPGLLAQTILDIRSGQSSPFTEEVLKDVLQQIRKANGATTYQSLRPAERQLPETEEQARALLLHECHRLLGELLAQQHETHQA